MSNYIFIPHYTPDFNGLGKESFKTKRESFKFWELVGVILDIRR